MFALFCALSAIMLFEAALTFFKIRRFRDFYLPFRNARTHDAQRAMPWPQVALLAPCKGIDPNLRENIDSWFAQDYPNYRIFFIVESDTDPVFEIAQTYTNAEIFIAGKAEDCGQKVHNLQYAIDHLPESIEVFAFVDSDCFLDKDWLKKLTTQILKMPDNAATGYRWFTHQRNLGSFLRAVWNSSVLTLYEKEGKRNFAWGGSMAIARTAYESCRVRDYWRGSISDDYRLTDAMQSNGRHVEFVPGVIGWTKDSITVAGFFRWAFRQLLITRIYNPRLWVAAFFFHALWLLWILSGILFPFYFVVVFLFVQLVQACKADLRLQCIPVGNRVLFWLSGPLIGLCNTMFLIGTLFTHTVIWRGRKYILLSKQRVVVLDA